MRKYCKLSFLFPLLLGVVIGSLLFIVGEMADAPGLCLMGLVFAYLLGMLGAYIAKLLRKEIIITITLIGFGIGSVILSINLLLEGEFGNNPKMVWVGVILGVILTASGLFYNGKRRKNERYISR